MCNEHNKRHMCSVQAQSHSCVPSHPFSLQCNEQDLLPRLLPEHMPEAVDSTCSRHHKGDAQQQQIGGVGEQPDAMDRQVTHRAREPCSPTPPPPALQTCQTAPWHRAACTTARRTPKDQPARRLCFCHCCTAVCCKRHYVCANVVVAEGVTDELWLCTAPPTMPHEPTCHPTRTTAH